MSYDGRRNESQALFAEQGYVATRSRFQPAPKPSGREGRASPSHADEHEDDRGMAVDRNDREGRQRQSKGRDPGARTIGGRGLPRDAKAAQPGQQILAAFSLAISAMSAFIYMQ